MAQDMAKTLSSQLVQQLRLQNALTDPNSSDTVPAIERTSSSVASTNGLDVLDRRHTDPGSSVGESEEEKSHSFKTEEEDRFRTANGNRQDENWPDTRHAPDDSVEALFLGDDPANMSSWAGQPTVKGSSEVMRMILLTFSSVGMTCV